MQFDKSKVVLFHGVVDLRKGAAGLVALVDDPEPGTLNSQGVSPIYFVFLKPSTLSSLFPYARD